MSDYLHLFLQNAAARKPQALAIIDHDDRAFSWAELWPATQDARDRLQAADVRPGDRVVLVLENCVEVVAFFFATTLLKATAVAVNARMSQQELDRITAHCDPAALVFTTSSSRDARTHAKHCAATPVTGAFGEVALATRTNSTPQGAPQDPAELVALLLYTSGTTGAPKAAMLTHTNLIAAAHASCEARGIREGDMTYLALPLSHIFGLVTTLAVCFAQGSMRLEARFSVERLYDALQRDVTVLPAVPQMHAHLLQYARANGMPKYDKGLLRYVSSGGAPLDPAWKRDAESFYGMPLQNGYGLTECAAGVCLTRNDIGDPDISVGEPMLDSALRLDFNADGAMADEGIGEILVRGPQVMKGYFQDPEQTAQVLSSGGEFRTGDLGRFDDKGRLHIVGRSKELIIRSGFNVYPAEVEAALTEHADVVVAAVVGRTVKGNEEVLAFVKTAPDAGLRVEDLRSFLVDQLAPYKRPSHIIIAHDLPAAPTGKILKSTLTDHFASELAKSSGQA